jgi:uncharacterized cysteine cluster protein YcgN (CxxCxxCC family)
MQKPLHFWAKKPLEQLNTEQWEALCDGCGRCCLQKLEDEDSGETFFTRVACQLLDVSTCRCTDYENRFERVSDCTNVSPLTEEKRQWLPKSCAYRRLDEGKNLPSWHYLLSADPQTIHLQGISVAGWAISEDYVDESLYEQLLIDFDENDQVTKL